MTVTLSVNMAAVAGTLYVAPNGDDAAPGSIEEPLGSLAGVRDAVRKRIAADGGILREPVTVYFREGTYRFTETVVFGSEDSGSAIAGVTYAAYEGETPVFSGGIPVQNWERTELKGGSVWKASEPWAKENRTFHALFDGETLLPRSRSKRFINTRELHKKDGRWQELMHETSIRYVKTRRDEYTKLHCEETLLTDMKSVEHAELLAGLKADPSKALIVGEFGVFDTPFPKLSDAAAWMGQLSRRLPELGAAGWIYWTYDCDEQERLWNAMSGKAEILQALPK